MNKLEILVCCHKADSNIRKDEPYHPIQVGKAIHSELNLGFLNDNEGENISEKNPGWNELTALYWGWKNIHDTEYLGLCHYRRYFDVDWNSVDIDKFMDGYDILTVQNYIGYEMNMNRTGLVSSTSLEDFYIYIDTLLSLHPECKQPIIDYFYNYNKFVPFNMFIAKKEIYDNYCEFIFPVLFEFEKRIKPHSYSRLKRVVGYMGEWSLGMFILCKALKVKEVPFVLCGESNHMKPIKYSIWELLKWKCKMQKVKFMSKRIDDVSVPTDVRLALKQDLIDLRAI